jgi:hypothetical protein
MNEQIQRGLELIKDLSWAEVFEFWRVNEAYPKSHWHEHYQSRGFTTWDNWRLSYVNPLGLQNLNWQLYLIKEPLITIPNFCGGPYRSWIELFYQEQKNPTFATLALHPQVQKHTFIQKLLADFPAQTTITGVMVKDRVVILEGMHRCAALAVAAEQNLKIETEVQIALAEYDKDELPIVGQQIKS